MFDRILAIDLGAGEMLARAIWGPLATVSIRLF
jgi:hypothetical protein